MAIHAVSVFFWYRFANHLYIPPGSKTNLPRSSDAGGPAAIPPGVRGFEYPGYEGLNIRGTRV